MLSALKRFRPQLVGRAAPFARPAIPVGLIAVMVGPGRTRRQRASAAAGLVVLWSAVYGRYRRAGIAQTEHERELLRTANWEAFTRHYNERVPTIEEEFDIWGEYHQHRHEMRYDLVAAAVRRHLPPGGAVLDIGCGSALVADRITDIDADYLGLDFGGHHITYASKKYAGGGTALRTTFCRGDAEGLPFPGQSFDVVVMSEVIEHLLRPEKAVWEISRILRPGGVWIMTTNNASEVPLRSPLTHMFAWIEKALGVHHRGVISLRPWIWPWPVDRALLPEDAPDVYLPHTHHIFAESRQVFASAGLDTFHFSSFEFPPAQAEISQRLDKLGDRGKAIVDVIEAVCQRVPLVNRLGAHMLVYARKTRDPVSPNPPAGLWSGPFSE
jgi:ubiquinone/menaquinone biosynthesis C-methylase UbiE